MISVRDMQNISGAPARLPPEPVAWLVIDRDGENRGTCIALYSPVNRWCRFWYWVLLGWEVESR